MEHLKVNLKKIQKNEIDRIVNFLNRGKVIVYPTDTIYGLGCLATDKKAIKKIYKIKKREKGKPMLILVSSLAMAKKYSRINKAQNKYLKKIWPGPVSVVLEKKRGLPRELSGGLKTQAMRLPKNDFLLKIIRKLGAPIISTSLNLSGKAPAKDVRGISRIFKKEKPDLVVDGGKLKGRSSKLIDLRDVKNIKIIRK
ncbi:MAG: L-threonylcarbamoyladenylate synthase [Patescibacteria group bacterium]|jgi:tRNA threonylcarbamoyl adenosine modification protein (Sua5/YciO/YrdC/YwlC family)